MTSDDRIEPGAADGGRLPFLERLDRAREVWALQPDKTRLSDAERLKLILVLIDLKMSYVIDAGFDGENRSSGRYMAYLCMLLSMAATGFRSDVYLVVLGPDSLWGVGAEPLIDQRHD